MTNTSSEAATMPKCSGGAPMKKVYTKPVLKELNGHPAFTWVTKTKKHINMLGNFGITVAAICALSGVFVLYSGIASSDMNQVLCGAALLSVGLVTVFLVVKSKLEWARTLKRYRERLD